jgi:hypothetical protein
MCDLQTLRAIADPAQGVVQESSALFTATEPFGRAG